MLALLKYTQTSTKKTHTGINLLWRPERCGPSKTPNDYTLSKPRKNNNIETVNIKNIVTQ